MTNCLAEVQDPAAVSDQWDSLAVFMMVVTINPQSLHAVIVTNGWGSRFMVVTINPQSLHATIVTNGRGSSLRHAVFFAEGAGRCIMRLENILELLFVGGASSVGVGKLHNACQLSRK